MYTVSSKFFTHNANDKQFSANISTLQWAGFPESFIMKSHVTGVEKIFRKYDMFRDNDGDLSMVHYRAFINGSEYDAIVFND